ncbi:unnamed protein product [Rotaria sp. Silwood2]|nr:unnamed protein product [Rotaria sp. Silwood2]
MVRQASFIVFILITILFELFNKANCKSGGGHYSSQRSLGTGSSGGYGVSAGNQQNFWGNSWFPQDMNAWYDYALNDSDSIPDEQRLMAQLLRNYDPSARPVYNASNTVNVAFGIALAQLSDMDEKNQEWYDERLVWNASDFNGLVTLRLPCSKIWLPDIVLYNSADDYTQGYYQSKAMVDSNGHVFWPPPAKFRSSCKIDVTFFPFDDQLCKLKFGSWTYDAAQVNLTKRRDHVDMTNYIRSGEWHIVHIEIKRNDVTYPCCPEIYYPDVTIYVHIRRRVLYYLFNIIFPCIWLSILSLLGFWLPPDSGEKITLGITVLLAFSVFMLLIAESMPATSEMVPLIEIYLTIVMALTSLSIVLTVYVLQLHHSGPVVIPIPHSFKYSLVRYVVPVIRMKKVVETYAQEHNLIETDEVYQCFAKPKTKPIDSPLINNKKNFIFEKKKNIKYRQNNSYREEPQCNDNDNDNDDDDDDDKEIMKEFLSNPSLCNGDIRSVPSFNKRSPNQHHHRSRSRVPQIVLIPQQSHPLSSSPRNLINHTQYECFNSNMSLLEKHLKHLINKQKHEEEKNEIINEWKLMALIMDRLLFWIFTSLTILSTLLCLIIIPCLKNVGFIPALSKDLTMDYKSVETLRNVVEEQIKPNLTGTSG